jgi:hypothetical protein
LPWPAAQLNRAAPGVGLLDVAVADARGLLVNLITGSTLTGASQAAYREGLVAIGAKDACVPAPAVTPWSSAPPAPT